MPFSSLRLRVIAIGLALALVAPRIRAQAVEVTPVVTKVTADVGYVAVSGNTEVTTFNAGEKFTQARERLSLEQGLALVYSKQADSLTTNSLRANARGDFKIDRLLAVFTGVTFDRNRFAGIERRFEESLGITARVIGAPNDTMRVEGGGTFTQQVGTDGVQQNFPSARAAINYRHGFTAASYFTQIVEYMPNMKESEDWRINTESAVVAPLSARIGIKISYVIRYDNLPQLGFLTTDRLFTTGLQITF